MEFHKFTVQSLVQWDLLNKRKRMVHESPKEKNTQNMFGGKATHICMQAETFRVYGQQRACNVHTPMKH